MTMARLIQQLQNSGHATVADYVRNGYHPGMVLASLEDIRDYCLRKQLRTPAKIIQLHLDEENA